MVPESHRLLPSLVRSNGASAVSVKALSRGDTTTVLLLEGVFSASERINLQGGGNSSIALVHKGGLAFPAENATHGHRILLPNTIALLHPELNAPGLAMEGNFSCLVVTWKHGVLPSLDRYLIAWLHSRKPGVPIPSMSISALSCDVQSAIDQSLQQPQPQSEFALLACVLNVVPALTQAPNRITIAPIPKELPEQVQSLVSEVRANPALPWSLTDASNLAGYSSFHFSRMFKQLVGCGFHEFVDRCRTELAVAFLADPEVDPSNIWSMSGFPSVRAMRESVRDYLSLTVNDLRHLSEVGR